MYGVQGVELMWFQNYLSGRSQVCGATSSWHSVGWRVPQGSVLGPLLLSVFVNDLPDVVNSQVNLYADDTTLYHSSTDVADLKASIESDVEGVSN